MHTRTLHPPLMPGLKHTFHDCFFESLPDICRNHCLRMGIESSNPASRKLAQRATPPPNREEASGASYQKVCQNPSSVVRYTHEAQICKRVDGVAIFVVHHAPSYGEATTMRIQSNLPHDAECEMDPTGAIPCRMALRCERVDVR